MKLLVGAGGTGGHIIPAVAVAREMHLRGWDIIFIGNINGLEEEIAHKNDFTFLPINVQKIYRKFTFKHLRFPFMLFKSYMQCLGYIIKYSPDAVLCTGGFVSGPIALAAANLKKPLYFQDGNSYPGLTTRMMSKRSKHIFIASDDATKYLRNASCVITGNPIIKPDLTNLPQIDYSSLNLSADSQKLFVVGGSQGSAAINHIVTKCFDAIRELGLEIIWQTGKSHYQSIISRFSNVKGVHIFDFTDKMNWFYTMADIAISRAGALSIAELEEFRIPALFIPLPNAAENHQYFNAVTQQEKGCGMVIEQKCLSPHTLIDNLKQMLGKLTTMQEKLKQLPANNATQSICDIISNESRQSKE